MVNRKISVWPPACSMDGCNRPGLPVNTKNPLRLCEEHLLRRKVKR